MRYEGGGRTHKVAGDPGGTTKWGIAQRYHPDIDVTELTEIQARDIARKEYWDTCRCDDLPFPMDILVWDAAFNMGVARAGKFLQKSYNSIHRTVPKYQLKVDGIIGPETIKAIYNRPEWDNSIIREFQLHRINFYRQRTNDNTSQTKFLRGWLNRSINLLIEVGIEELEGRY